MPSSVLSSPPMVARTAAVLLVLAGIWARCANFRPVFPEPDQVELLPSDSHYYTRFARLQLHVFPRYQAFDPYVSYPEGARVILPPLHAWAVTAAVAVAGEPRAELGAAWVGPALAALWLVALLLLAWRVLGTVAALALTALLGLTPVLVDAGALGNADHHLHEGFLAAAVPLAMAALVHRPSLGIAALAGALLGTGRLLAPSAFMFVPCAALAAALAAFWRPEDGGYSRALAWTGGITAGIGAIAAITFGSPRSLAYEEVSAFHPLLALACFGGATGIALLARNGRRLRASAAPVAALLVAAVAGMVLLRPLRDALAHLGRADPLLALVTESQPLWRDPRWALRLLGMLLPALPLGLFLASRQVRRTGDAALLATLCMVIPLLGASVLQARFAPALAGCASVLLAGCLARVESARLRRIAVAAGALPLLLSLAPQSRQLPPADVRLVRPTLRWMRDHLPPASANPYGPFDGGRPRYGVVASYLLGHTLPLWSERPSVTTLFSQIPVHVEGNRRAAAVLAATKDEDAYGRALATGARYVLVTPSDRIVGHEGADIGATAMGKLLEHGWMAAAEDTTAHFRLVHDSDEQRLRPGGGSYARLFEVVPGAVLRGNVLRAEGPEVAGRGYVKAGREGEARVAYPGRYRVACSGGTAVEAEVSEEDIRTGAEIPVPGCEE